MTNLLAHLFSCVIGYQARSSHLSKAVTDGRHHRDTDTNKKR